MCRLFRRKKKVQSPTWLLTAFNAHLVSRRQDDIVEYVDRLGKTVFRRRLTVVRAVFALFMLGYGVCFPARCFILYMDLFHSKFVREHDVTRCSTAFPDMF